MKAIVLRILLPLLAGLSLVAGPAAAWNKTGHAAVAAIAEANLTPAALAQVKELLKDDLDANNQPSGRTTLADVASWPDEIRRVDKDNKYVGWHTRSNPVCAPKLGPCWLGRCLDRNLVRYIKVLQDRRANHRRRNEALKWVVHLVGDMHQPLHSGSNRDSAGNAPASLEGGQLLSLHWLWDRELLEAAVGKNPVTAKLQTSEKLEPYNVTVMMWMLESREVALKEVYGPLKGFQCGKDFPGPYVLDQAYQAHSVGVIRQQIATAGLRLAQLLNELLK